MASFLQGEREHTIVGFQYFVFSISYIYIYIV